MPATRPTKTGLQRCIRRIFAGVIYALNIATGDVSTRVKENTSTLSMSGFRARMWFFSANQPQ
jgi:hypothetical protein